MSRWAILDGSRGCDIVRVAASRALVRLHLEGQLMWVDHGQLNPSPLPAEAAKVEPRVRAAQPSLRTPPGFQFEEPESFTLCTECLCAQCECGR